MGPALVEFLVIGAIGGALSVLIAFALRRYTREILFFLLIGAAAAYVYFALRAGETPLWLFVELVGVGVYGLMGFRGLRGSPWWLVAGWALHVIWDVGLHYFGPGRAFAPVPYTIACVSWDLVVAGYLGYRITRGTPWYAAPPRWKTR